MLRVHRFEEPYSVRLRIEGALTADVLDAVERSWQEAVADARGRKLLLDASGVIRADAAGIASLGRMASQGGGWTMTAASSRTRNQIRCKVGYGTDSAWCCVRRSPCGMGVRADTERGNDLS